MAHMVSMEIERSIKIPMQGGPSADANTVIATTNDLILPRCMGPYNSAHRAVIPVYNMPTFSPSSKRYGHAHKGLEKAQMIINASILGS